jgi:hypothetical protein
VAVSTSRFITLIGSCLILFTLISRSYSTIHSGFGYADFDSAWDFSDSSNCVLWYGFCGDLAMGITLMQTATEPTGGIYMYATASRAGIAIASLDSTYEELTTAPEDSNAYYGMVVPYPHVVYVMRTAEGHYAKFRGVDLGPGGDFTFEYSYQDNGTRVLVGGVPTGIPEQTTTWGRMKALYAE